MTDGRLEIIDNMIRDSILWFGELTNMDDLVTREIESILFGVACIAILSCLLGIKLYRAVFSLILFLLVVITFSLLWKENSNWGYVAAGFSVCGIVLGFLGIIGNDSGRSFSAEWKEGV